MTDQRHSPEPWKIVVSGHVIENTNHQVVIEDAEGASVKDLERVVACVNALAGISTEALEALFRNELLREQTVAIIQHNAEWSLRETENV